MSVGTEARFRSVSSLVPQLLLGGAAASYGCHRDAAEALLLRVHRRGTTGHGAVTWPARRPGLALRSPRAQEGPGGSGWAVNRPQGSGGRPTASVVCARRESQKEERKKAPAWNRAWNRVSAVKMFHKTMKKPRTQWSTRLAPRPQLQGSALGLRSRPPCLHGPRELGSREGGAAGRRRGRRSSPRPCPWGGGAGKGGAARMCTAGAPRPPHSWDVGRGLAGGRAQSGPGRGRAGASAVVGASERPRAPWPWPCAPHAPACWR